MREDIKRLLLHLIAPTRCPVCGDFIRPDERFCPECEAELTVWNGEHTIPGADSFTAAYEYNDAVKPAVMLLKNGIADNADYALGGALHDRLKENGIIENADVILPVPMTQEAVSERGFNQAVLICRRIGKLSGLPVSECLEKQTETLPQKTLNKAQRAVNLRDAFTVTDPDTVKGSRILLVDDVCTTGSTLAELTWQLKFHGAKAVYCAACCKTPPVRDDEELPDNG
ncbi:MAG: ComF family protein [Ruminococcus sp.]|nr:ComF family protein [Ruminococcus sp.]